MINRLFSYVLQEGVGAGLEESHGHGQESSTALE